MKKVYVALEYDCVLNVNKIISIHESFDGAYDAISDMADYDGNAGYGFNIVKDKEKGRISIDSLFEDEWSEIPQYYVSAAKRYIVYERPLFK